MTIYEAAIQIAKKYISELTAADIAQKYNSDIGAAAGTLYKEALDRLLKENQTTDLQKDIGAVIAHPFHDTIVYLEGEDKIPD